jgi:hypothetical protein
MPRCVRNFWIEAQIDGRKSPFASGPKRKDGGFSLKIYMRNKGAIETVLRVAGYEDAGRLYLDLDSDVFGALGKRSTNTAR